MRAFKEFAKRLNLFSQGETITRERGLEYWRGRIYNYLISAMLIFGLLALIPSVWLSFTSNLIWLGIVDLTAYAIVLALALSKDFSYKVRAAILLFIGLGIGIAVFYATGDEGAGLFWLFAVPPFAALMLGLQWGLAFISINALIIWGSTYLVLMDVPTFPGLAEFSVMGWMVYGINFLVANAIVTIPLGILMNGLLHSREREEQVARDYQLLFETNPLPMWVYDLKTLRFLAVNESAVEHYGYSHDEFLDMTIKDIRPHEEVASLEQNLAKTANQVKQGSGPWKHLKKDGTIIDVEIFSNSFEFEGRAARLVMANDVTDRIRSQEKLRESDEILKRVKSLVLVLNSEGRVVYASPSSAEILGYSSSELLGEGWWQLTREDPREAEEEKETLRRVASGDIPLSAEAYERPIEDRLGNVHWIEWKDSLGPNNTVIGVGHEITERKLSAQEMEQRLAELEAIRKVSTELRSAESTDEMVTVVLDTVLNVLGVGSGGIWLYDAASNEVRLELARNWQGVTTPEKPGAGLAGFVFASGQLDVTPDLQKEQRIPEEARVKLPAGLGAASVPIRSQNTVIGVLTVNTNAPRAFSENELNLLGILAEIAGTAIQRTRLNEQKERTLEMLTALSQIDRAILSSFDLQMNLKLLLRNVVDQLEVDAANVLLYNPILQTLESTQSEGFRTTTLTLGSVQLGRGLAGQAAFERRSMTADLSTLSTNPRLAKAVADEGFVSYVNVPLIAKGEIRGVLEIFHRDTLDVTEEWRDLLNALAGRAAIAIDAVKGFEDLQTSNAELMLSYDSTIEGWSRALDLRDRETEGHSQRVTSLALMLAQALGLAGGDLVNLRRGALLHDIGKMGVPDAILFKPGKLTAKEWEVMRQHPTFARDMLLSISYLKDALDIPYSHHEKWDGSGYPRGLKDVEIPLAARIFAVVDVYDALSSDRPYRKAWTKEKTLDYIREQSGHHFDPNVVDHFMSLEEIAAVRKGLEPAML